jgi:hypothetical protein
MSEQRRNVASIARVRVDFDDSAQNLDFGDSAQNYCESRLDEEPPPTRTRPEAADSAASRKRLSRGIGDDEAVLLICPTCQISAQSVGACDRLLLCMGLFSTFLPRTGVIPRCDSPRLTLRANLAIIWPECLSRSSLLPRLSKTSGG